MTIVILVVLRLPILVRIVTLAVPASLTLVRLALGVLTPSLLALLPRAGYRRGGFNR
jgi:hypothetical protein